MPLPEFWDVPQALEQNPPALLSEYRTPVAPKAPKAPKAPERNPPPLSPPDFRAGGQPHSLVACVVIWASPHRSCGRRWRAGRASGPYFFPPAPMVVRMYFVWEVRPYWSAFGLSHTNCMGFSAICFVWPKVCIFPKANRGWQIYFGMVTW